MSLTPRLGKGGCLQRSHEVGKKERMYSIDQKRALSLFSQWFATFYTAAVSLGLTFLLGRVLGPEGFGGYSYVLTLASLFLIVQDGGFKSLLFREKTLVSPQIAEYNNSLFSWALGHMVMISLAGAFFVLVLPLQYRAGIFAALVCFGLQAVAGFVSSDLRARGLFARDGLWQVAVRTFGALGILAAVFLLQPLLPWTIFSGWALGLVFCLFLSPVPIARPSFHGFQIRDIRRTCLGFMAIGAATTIYYRCDIILLELLTGDQAQVGYYAAAYRFLDGIVLMAVPLSTIWFRKLRLVWNQEEVFKGNLVVMVLIMLAAAIVILLAGLSFGKEIVFITFGDGYGSSARLLPWILSALIFVLPNGILTQAAIARNRERLYAICAATGAVFNIGLNLILIPRFGGMGAAWATIATELFLTVGLVFGLRRKTGKGELT